MCDIDSERVMETNWSSLSASVHQEDGSSVPQIGLSLELGRGSEMLCDEDHKVVVNNKNRPLFQGFTILQLQELQLQALIFKYIEAALPVPYHLLLPIWQSFSSSLASYPTCKYCPPTKKKKKKSHLSSFF